MEHVSISACVGRQILTFRWQNFFENQTAPLENEASPNSRNASALGTTIHSLDDSEIGHLCRIGVRTQVPGGQADQAEWINVKEYWHR